jgi:hypothetical protein
MGRYLTAAQLITRLGLDPATDEDLLEEYIESAEAAIDGETGRRFDSVTETRQFDITAPGEYLSVGDLISVTAVGVADATGGTLTALTATDYFLGPSVRQAGHPYRWLNLSDVGSYSYDFGYRTVEIAGTWGWSAVPADIKQIVASVVARTYQQSRGGGVSRITDIPGLGTVEFSSPASSGGVGGFTADETRTLARYRRVVLV